MPCNGTYWGVATAQQHVEVSLLSFNFFILQETWEQSSETVYRRVSLKITFWGFGGKKLGVFIKNKKAVNHYNVLKHEVYL